MGRATRGSRARLALTIVAPAALLLASVLTTAGPAGASAPPSPTWSSLSPPSAPAGLHDASEAYDAANQTVVLFGGDTANGSPSSATWVWNGSTWSQAVPQLQGPAARSGASLAYSQGLNQLILFGGLGTSGPLNDTWAWNGQSWVALTPASTPPGREDASLAVDANGNLVLFGGTGAVAPAGTTNQASPVSSSAAPGSGSQAGTSTTALSSSALSSTAVSSTAVSTMAASTSLGVLDDTWVWDGSNWTVQSGPQPPARSGATFTWDPTVGATVLFGGSGTAAGTTPHPLSDTWVWSGSAWAEAVPATSPPARTEAVADFAPGLGGVVVTTGTGSGGALNDTWSYDGTTWNAVTAATPPTARTDATGAWDAATQQLVVFGGQDADGTTLADTVVLTATAPVTANPPGGGGSSGGGGGSGATGGGGTTASTSTTAPSGATTSPTTSGHGATAGHSAPSTVAKPTTTATGSPTTATPAGGTATPAAGAGSSSPTLAGPAPAAVQTVHAGSLVTLLGSGFAPGSSVTITFHSTPYTVGRVTADASGNFSATVAVPTGASPGSHHLVATGMSPSGRLTSLITPIQVVALPGTASHGTPTSTTLIMVGVAVLIPVATWTALAIRSRRRSLTPAR